MSDVQTRLRELVERGQAIAAKATRTADESKDLESILAEVKELKAQNEQNIRAAQMFDGLGQSAGGLAVSSRSGDVEMTGFKAAGETVINTHAGVPVLAEEYGEGIIDAATAAKLRTPEYRVAFRDYLRFRPGSSQHSSALRVLQESNDQSGGFLVPQDVQDYVISRKPTPTRVQTKVTQLTTGRDSVTIPKVNYNTDDLFSTGVRVVWSGENANPSNVVTTDPQFGQVRIPIYTAMLALYLTRDIVEDAAFDLVSFVAGKFAETVEGTKDQIIIQGNGLNQPLGILANPGTANNPAVITSGDANLPKAASLIKCAMSIPEQYDDNVNWVMNKVSTAQAIAQINDTNGRPLWGTGVQDSGLEAGYKDRRLVGYPVMFSGFMPNVATNAYVAICGDLTGYTMVNRVGFSVEVLREVAALSNQVIVLGRMRFGGQVTEDWKLKTYQIHT